MARKKGPVDDKMKATRLTFRLDEETVARFKVIAAHRRLKLEELGREAIIDVIKKHKQSLRELVES